MPRLSRRKTELMKARLRVYDLPETIAEAEDMAKLVVH